MDSQNNILLEKKYLVCIGNTDSHKGALNFLCESLKSRKDIVIEFFIAAIEETDGGFFANHPDACDVDNMNEEVVRGILNESERFVQSRISNKIIKTVSCGEIPKCLLEKIRSDNSIVTLIIGSSPVSKNVSKIIEKICNDVMIPIFIIPCDITNEQIVRVVE